MTDERRQDVLIGALVLSVIVHIALMIFIKPQIMTHVTNSSTRAKARDVSIVKDAKAPQELIEMTSVQDVEAIREAPEESKNLPPLSSAFDAPEKETELAMPKIEAPSIAKAPELKSTIAPHLFEKIHIAPGISSVTTPVVSDSMRDLSPSKIATAPIATDVNAKVEVPLFTAPVLVSKVAMGSEAIKVPAALPADEKGDGEKFVPGETVRDSVDEKIVATEKEAVRELLNVRDAESLEKFVSLVATSATSGEWTYFRVQISPRSQLATVPKDVVVLLDASGSIGKDRLKSCRSAARALLRSCTNTGDRFNLVAFRDKFSYAFNSWQDCNNVSMEKADKWLNSLVAHGRTDVFSVIRSVLTLPRNPSRPLIALVVTDGDANTGVHETAQILSKFTALNDGLISVYMYGVKGSANRELIDVLTHGNRGESYVYDGFRWSAGSYIEGLSEHFRDPVLSDLRLVFATGTEAEAYPRRLRNIYKNGIVDFVGRVPAKTKEIAFSLRGLNGEKAYEGFFKLDLTEASFDAELPIRWNSELAIDKKLR